MVKQCFLGILYVSLQILPFVVTGQRLHPHERDIVEFYNRDRLVGEVKKLQRGELTFDPDKIDDDVVLKLKDIRVLIARRKPYVIEDLNTHRYFGIMEPAEHPGMVNIINATDTITLYIEDLASFQEMDANFWKRLSGNVSAGFSFTRSSNIGRINGSNSLEYATRLWTWRLNGDIIYTMDEDFTGIEKADLVFGGYVEFWRHFFSVTQVQYQRITELGVSARIQAAEGVGPILLKNRHTDLRLASGISVQQEFTNDSTKGNSSSSSVEIPLFLNYYLFRLGTPQVKLQFTNSLFFSTSQPGRWRFDQNTVLSWKIVKHLNTSLQLYVNYDSRPLDASANKMDYGIVFSIGYSW